MNSSPDRDEQLERFIHQTLRDLPRRRAPGTLESRVMAELERRAALPWWHKSYAYWPLPVRCVFLVISAGIAKFALMAGFWLLKGFDLMRVRETFSTELAWMRIATDLGHTFADSVAALVYSIPAVWLYGGAAVIAALYVTLFGLGTVAYRALYASR